MKVFIVFFRLMLLYFGLQTIFQLSWLITQLTTYSGELDPSFTLQIWDIIGRLLFIGLLIVAWLMPRKFLGILPSDVGNWPDDIRALSDKLPQLVVFGIGLTSLLSSITLVSSWLFDWLITNGADLTLISFGPQHFWALLWAAFTLGIPLLMMFYSKPISRFFIKP